jgi:ABC-2 type transport system permease protein
VPEQALTPWFRTIARLNPVTYILAGLRSLLVVGWAWGDIAQALLAILVVGVVSIGLAFKALNGRVKKR